MFFCSTSAARAALRDNLFQTRHKQIDHFAADDKDLYEKNQ